MSSITVPDAYADRLLEGMGSCIQTFFDGYSDVLEKPRFNEDATRILNERYFIKDASGNVIETPELLLARVALGVQYPYISANRDGVDCGYDFEYIFETAAEYYNLMARLDFLPGSPTLMNAGTPMGQLAACFVVPIEDDMTSIMDGVKSVALIHQSGGGTGMDFSSLRPKGAIVKSTSGVASGPISFMKIYDATTEQIKQGGKRRGANMGMLRCLAGETMIHTLEGRRPISELVGTRPYVYAADPVAGRVRVVLADKVFVSDTDRQMVRVWMDNDTFIDCTPDHCFMLSDGSYTEAQGLVRGDSLMAFASAITPSNKEQGGNRYHRVVGMTGFGKQAEHRVVAQDVLGWDVDYDNIVHHIDGDVLNNMPENLERLDRESHGRLHHGETISDHQKRIASERKGKALEEVYGSEKATAWKQKMSDAAKVRNHKVVKVEWLEDKAAEVYDISLPEYHNFAANEVFVHNCDHPDILEFISCKDDDKSLQNFNISVAVTDRFMQALEGKTDTRSNVYLVGTGLVLKEHDYCILDPKTGNAVDVKDAREVWQLLVEHAWNTGDPGIIFIDRVNEQSPFDVEKYPEHRMVATNPCGEQPLEAFEACNLGSINLANFVNPGDSIYVWDFERLLAAIPTCVRMLDDVVEASIFPLPQIGENVRKNRKVGFGVMGFADALIKHGVAYGSDDSYRLAASVMEFVNKYSHEASSHLADERGTFSSWKDSKYFDTMPMRNATLTTIAPTGTISMLANGTSSGIEPVFAFAFTKKVMGGKKFYYVHPAIDELLSSGAIDRETYDGWLESGVIDGLPEDTYLVGAMDVTPEQHVRMQAAFQEHVDNAVSKTVNLPNSATTEDVDAIYRLAFDLGCKGTTIYRDGSKSDQVLFTGSKSENATADPTVAVVVKDEEAFELITDALQNPESYEILTKAEYEELTQPKPIKERPEAMLGMTVKGNTPCGNVYVTISEDDEGQPFEIFCKLGKSGACAGAVQETIGRLVSQELRSGGDIHHIIKQLRGASCGQSVGFGPKRVTSCIDAIGLILQRYADGEYHNQVVRNIEGDEDDITPSDAPVDKPVDLPAGPGAMYVNDGPAGVEFKQTPKAPIRHNGACPECGGPMEHEGGCAVCRACGNSKCA